MLRSTHPAFIPGTDQLLICSNDIEKVAHLGYIQLKVLPKVIIVTNFIKITIHRSLAFGMLLVASDF